MLDIICICVSRTLLTMILLQMHSLRNGEDRAIIRFEERIRKDVQNKNFLKWDQCIITDKQKSLIVSVISIALQINEISFVKTSEFFKSRILFIFIYRFITSLLRVKKWNIYNFEFFNINLCMLFHLYM